MESFAEQIKRLRKEKNFTLKTASEKLKIDPAILSKIENGKRIATKETVKKLAKYYKVNEKDLLIAWLSDKLIYESEDESLALEAFKIAEEKIAYRRSPPLSREKIIRIIRDFLEKDGRVSKAWIFGSFARGDHKPESDIDLMVKYSDRASGTLLDYADIKFYLENLIQKEIDLVEEGFVKPFAEKSIEKDKILIYG